MPPQVRLFSASSGSKFGTDFYIADYDGIGANPHVIRNRGGAFSFAAVFGTYSHTRCLVRAIPNVPIISDAIKTLLNNNHIILERIDFIFIPTSLSKYNYT